MISHKFRTVFVHIPKTAGQSIETAFLNAHGLTWETRAPLLLRRNDDPAAGPPRLAHLFAREYVALGHVTPRDFDAYHKFSVVRHPYDRAVSAYNYIADLPAAVRRMHESSAAERLRAALASLGLEPDALRRVCDRQADRAFEAFFEMQDTDLGPQLARFFASQSDYLTGQDGRLLVDQVLRFENLAAEAPPVLRRLLGAEAALPVRNLSTRPARISRDRLTAEQKEVLRVRYGKDFERFGYAP